MDVKYMQELIKNPIYAWILVTKWTWNKPIKAAYEWLVSIETWNKANRWKIKIIENEDSSISIEYKNKEEVDILPIVRKRNNYNSEYPYTKTLECPECWGILTWNNAKSRSWDIHKYYQCTWKKWVKHKNYSLRQKEVNKSIKELFTKCNINEDIIELFKIISEEVYKERKEELYNNKELYLEKIKWLKKSEIKIIENIDKVIDYPSLLKAKNKELEDIKSEIGRLKSKYNNIKEDININAFKKYSINIIKHIDKLVLQIEKPEIISLAFDVMFNQRVVFEKIDYQTTNNSGLLWIQSQQKNPQNEDLVENSNWQPTTLQNRTNLKEYMNKAIWSNITEFQKQINTWYEIFNISLQKWYFWL